jgi:hypothetical protein
MRTLARFAGRLRRTPGIRFWLAASYSFWPAVLILSPFFHGNAHLWTVTGRALFRYPVAMISAFAASPVIVPLMVVPALPYALWRGRGGEGVAWIDAGLFYAGFVCALAISAAWTRYTGKKYREIS